MYTSFCVNWGEIGSDPDSHLISIWKGKGKTRKAKLAWRKKLCNNLSRTLGHWEAVASPLGLAMNILTNNKQRLEVDTMTCV